MVCQFCGRMGYHDKRCPLYSPRHLKTGHIICSICEDEIECGEKYIENDSGDIAHLDCLFYGDEMAEFLGYHPVEMEEEENE